MKQLNLALAYPASSLEDVQGQIVNGQLVRTGVTVHTPAEMTRQLIAFAVTQSYRDGMDKQVGRTWVGIKRALADAEAVVELSDGQFNWLFERVDTCKFPAGAAEAASLLWDELEAVKSRKDTP